MKNNYVAFIDDTISEYVAYLIGNEPDIYATDGANNRIAERYFKDVYGVEVRPDIASKVSALIRAKSIFLENNIEFDKRIKDAGKQTPKKRVKYEKTKY